MESKEKELARYKRYRDKNKVARKISVARSQAKKYIKEYATLEELQELKTLISGREQEI